MTNDALDGVTWPLRTERLLLRRALKEDAEATWRHRRLPEVSHWLTSAPSSLEDYRTRFEEPAYLAKTLVIMLGEDLIGELMLSVGDGWAQVEVAAEARLVQAELGWVLHPDYTGHGYATEAVKALLRLCFEGLGLRRVTAGCFAANEPSWRLMERVGMRRETYAVRDALHRSGDWLDGMDYALLADEWATSVR